MITRLMHLLERLTEMLLWSLRTSIDVANLLICIFTILLGPALIAVIFTQ